MAKFVTPKGRATWPRLMKPDTKFDDHGEYSCDIVMSAEDAKPFAQKLRKAWKEYTGKANALDAKPKIFEKVLNDEGEETGDIKIRCRVKNKLIKKGQRAGQVWDRKPVLYDAKRNPLGESVVIGGGSLVRCCLESNEYEINGSKGVSFKLISVQVIELVESGFADGGASGDDFDEEDGFEGDTSGEDFEDEDGADEGSDDDVGDDDDF